MNTKAILTRGIQVTTFLFAAFNNFLMNITPPGETESRFAVGISSLLALFILLFISAISMNQPRKRLRKIWLTTSVIFFAVVVIASYIYKSNLDKLTFSFPPGSQKLEHIAGTTLTPEAMNYQKEHPFKTASEIVADYGGLAFIERVWTRDSIQRAKMILTINYVLVVLSIAAMIFSLTEGILVVKKRVTNG